MPYLPQIAERLTMTKATSDEEKISIIAAAVASSARQAALQAEAEPHLMFLGVVSGLSGLVTTFADPQKAGTIIEDLVDILRA
jgi:hypothetical protein